MSEVTAKGFVDLLNKSGLVETARLKVALKDLARKSGGETITIDQLTRYLLDEGLISEWHCKKLLSGKYKGFFLGKYKLIRHLGTGGMSSVYLAENMIFSQKRAIKVLPKSRISDKTYLERFYREGRAAASLNHKNIVRVYDIDNEGDTHYLVMEFVEGQDIYDMVKESGPLDYTIAIDYTTQALTGLMHAHENDLVHRDIKPANLLVTPEGTVKILDLGLALFQEEDTSLTVMHNERVLGTADYLSPEQAVDSHNIDHRSDIYSTGCTLYYMLTGKPPFHEGTLAQRIAMHQVREPQSVLDFRKDCPPELVDVLKKMMAKKPDERYQNGQEAITALRHVSEHLFSDSTRLETSAKPVAATQPAKPARQPAAASKAESRPAPGKQVAGPAGTKEAARRETARADKGRGARQPAVAKSDAAAQKQSGQKQSRPKQSRPKQAAQKPPSRKPAARQPAATQPAAQKTVTKKPAAKQQPARTARAQAPGQSGVGRKPHVEATSVTVVVPYEGKPVASSAANDTELQQFVRRSSPGRSPSARVKRRPIKNQLIVAGMVIGMFALLGLAMLLAMFLTAQSEEDKNETGSRLPVPYVTETIQVAGMCRGDGFPPLMNSGTERNVVAPTFG